MAAGVSQSTVSIVLAGKWNGRVSARTAQAVREAAERLGYRPNLAARNLRLGQTRTVLFVVPTLTSPFSAPHEAIDGVLASSMASDALTDLVVSPLPSRDHAMVPAGMRERVHDHGGEGGIPLVMLDSDPGGVAPTVNVDVADGMRSLVEHLAGLGHRRFWHLAADVDAWTFRTRGRALAGAVAELPDATLARRNAPITVDGARDATGAWLREAGRATALLCDDDVMAAGAYKAARDAGLDIPGDLSITGFDDILLAEALEPELTTVRLPAEALGERAMSALLEILDGSRPPGVSLPGDLVVRASTAPPGS